MLNLIFKKWKRKKARCFFPVFEFSSHKRNLKYGWWPQPLFLELVIQPQLALWPFYIDAVVELLLFNISSVLDTMLSTLHNYLIIPYSNPHRKLFTFPILRLRKLRLSKIKLLAQSDE